MSEPLDLVQLVKDKPGITAAELTPLTGFGPQWVAKKLRGLTRTGALVCHRGASCYYYASAQAMEADRGRILERSSAEMRERNMRVNDGMKTRKQRNAEAPTQSFANAVPTNPNGVRVQRCSTGWKPRFEPEPGFERVISGDWMLRRQAAAHE